ncbi:hypothetical protein [Arthrobacter sp. OV608]|uniref:hypothetical protein n=1 Tax=Arthrobacter sp. OV608 TaxID=1882768 RepID=UPI0008BE9B41|nr:hypothetical protein [Arthrobacter sp. OV608]SER22964.1 hypothetical protein SAMN05444745_1253 [Arthrobacter sp. OV608]
MSDGLVALRTLSVKRREWAIDGRFPGRWDDLHGNFRTAYAGSMRAYTLEVRAGFRLDVRLTAVMDNIVKDNEDAVLHPGRCSGNGLTPVQRRQPN